MLIRGYIGAALVTAALARPVRRLDRGALGPWQRVALVTVAAAAPLASAALTSVEGMQGSGNAQADELAGNGLFTLAAALRRNELDYDRFYRTLPEVRAASVLDWVFSTSTPMTRLLS